MNDKFIFDMQIKIEVFYKMILPLSKMVRHPKWSIVKHAQSTQNKKFAYLCNISRKTWGVKFIFCLQINTKVFYKLIVSLWVGVARHSQSTQNNKFAIPLQYLKENVKDEVDFLPADKFQRFLQIDDMCSSVMPKLTKITSLLFLCNILRKN